MPHDTIPPRGFMRFYLWVMAALLLLAGGVLAAGGVWLLTLGGSFYYLVAGLLLIAAGIFYFRHRMLGFWLYLVAFAFTLVWAFWEKGLNGWAQVPRLGAPLVMLVLLLFTLPALRRADSRSAAGARGPVAAMAGVVAFGLYLFAQPLWQPPAAVAQAEVPTVAAPTEPAGATTSAPASLASTPRPQLETGADWPAYGGTHAALRYSPLDQINRDNAATLTEAWQYRTGDLPPEDEERYAAETTPIKVGDNLFLCSALNVIISIDARTGGEEWRFDPGVSPDAIPYSASCRGVAYYANPDATAGEACAARIIVGTLDARLIAVDAETGQPCADFGTNGEVDLEVGIGETVPGWYAVTSPPAIVRGIVVTGAQVKDGQAEDAPSGVIRGYDAVTGELAWAWDLGNPSLTGLPPEGEVYTRGTPNMWTIASGDEELGLVYLPLGNSSVDYYGSNRSELENMYATALVAIDVTTGKPAWHFQTVRYDVWDYDLGSQATLVDFPTNDGAVPAVILASKQGDIYVLDRRTGEALTPVEERPVPQGGVEPDRLSPTQPFSGYHTVAKRDLVEADMWGMTPFDQLWCRIQFRSAAYEGMYTPPTADRHWIQYPGYNGGSDWGGVAVDPVHGVIVANYNDMPNHNRLILREEVDAAGLVPINAPSGSPGDGPLGEAGPQVGAPYGIQVNAGWRMPTGLLCKEPPYGGIRAIELASGATLWDKPFGSARKNGPFGIPSMLPLDIGTPNNGGAVVTAGGLIFIAATTDDMFRAIDIDTGETVWEAALPAGGQANPFAYEIEGKQYVGLMTGGHHFMETPIGDQVTVWALP